MGSTKYSVEVTKIDELCFLLFCNMIQLQAMIVDVT